MNSLEGAIILVQMCACYNGGGIHFDGTASASRLTFYRAALNASITFGTSSSTIAEIPGCRVGRFWPKVEDDILQTL